MSSDVTLPMSFLSLAPVSSATSLLVVFFLPVLVYLQSAINWRRRSQGRPLPPGPKALPLVGNIHNAPKFRPWEGYRDLCTQYGECSLQPAMEPRAHIPIAQATLSTSRSSTHTLSSSEAQKSSSSTLIDGPRTRPIVSTRSCSSCEGSPLESCR